jgi:hypothetical protein
VLCLEENGLDIPELKAVYDELWSDAKALANDMKSSIKITRYAAFSTLAVLLAILTIAIPNLIAVATGDLNPLSLIIVAVTMPLVVLHAFFSRKLFRISNKLERKYSKLVELGSEAE